MINEEIYDIERLTHEQVCQRIGERPAVIIPLGGCEPFGSFGEMGMETACVTEIAREVSRRCRVLLAPTLPFGCSTPFMSFAGSAGVKPRTFVNMLCEIIHAYIFQRIEKILLISAAPFNKKPAEEAIRRLERMYPKVTIKFVDINTILDSRGIYDRNDALLLSLCQGDRGQGTGDRGKDIPLDQYSTWKKRGMDPEKFKKLSPTGTLLDSGGSITYDNGMDYFERIVSDIKSKAADFDFDVV